jgi:hypothetical protein
MAIRWTPAALAVLLAACSGGTVVDVKQDSEAVAGRDACSLMTLADMLEVYGFEMKKSDTNRSFSGPSNDVSLCTYEGGDPLVLATMQATWSKTNNPLTSRDAFVESLEKSISPDLKDALKVEKVEFQGLPALWQSGQLTVFNKGATLSILADPAPGKDKKQTIETLMSKALARL